MSRTPNQHLRRLLDEAGWNMSQLAAAVRWVAAEHEQVLACDRSTVVRWMAGTTPRPPAPQFLLETLSRRLGRPVNAVEAGLSRTPATVLDLSWEANPVRKLAELTRAELSPTSRVLLGTGVYSLAALAVPQLSELSQPSAGLKPSDSMPRQRAGQLEIEQMQTMTKVFAEAAELHGAGHVRTALTAYLNHDVTGYLHARSPEHTHRRLLSAAAKVTLLLSTVCAGDGADALAQHYHRTAAHLAAEANDPATYAIALRTMSAHAHDLGHHSPAVLNLAERAVEAARHTPPIVQAYAHAHLAVIQAHHDRHAAVATLAGAEHLHAHAETTPGPYTHYPLGALHYQRAQTLATLGDLPGATGALTASLRRRTPAEHHSSTLTQARLAETLLAQGHLDAALTHWQTFLDSYPTLHSRRATRRLHAMHRHLTPHTRHQAAAQLLSRATALG